jgi:diadenosine tetraphosphate (Ap4A) HIT family hydrolase
MVESMEDCVFCNLQTITHEIFYETAYFRGLYNLQPIFPGHSLIVPKRHVENFLELDNQELTELSFTLQKIADAIVKAYSVKSFDIILQNGKEAGQEISHLHFHILPRTFGDIPEGENWVHYFHKTASTAEEISIEEMKTNVALIKKTIQELT